MSNALRPIAIFDSGIGGLTVMKSLISQFPNESMIYLGDTARLPYGTKSKETIAKYLEQNLSFLIDQNVKAIVVACNSASSVLEFSEIESIPVYGVIEPGAMSATELTKNQKIGVLGTRATIQSDSYKKAILKILPNAEVFSCACPLFVPLAEEGLVDDPLTNLIAYRYLHELTQKGIDTLVLGCTHYPVLKSSIAKVTGSKVALIESGQALAQQLTHDFSTGRLKKSEAPKAVIHVKTTDDNHNMQQLIQLILGKTGIDSIETVQLK